MALYEWQEGPGRERNFKPWPAYRVGASNVPQPEYTLTVGNESTLYGHNANVGSIAPTDLEGVEVIELYHDTGVTDSLYLKFDGDAEAVTAVRIEMGDDVATLDFDTDHYAGTNTAIAAAILAANGDTIVLEIIETPATP